MYAALHELLRDRKNGAVFTCFGPWHLFWIGLTAAVFLGLLHCLRRRDAAGREAALGRLTGLAFGLYILDLFLIPLAYGQIDIEKLPFHACTAMCVMGFLSRWVPALERFRVSFALMGFLSNFIYLLYPAGVMWQGVHPLCYRVIQTLGFHGLMSVSCLLALVFSDRRALGDRRRHLAVTAAMTAWAMLGNYAYNSPDRLYNWFFVVRDPFGLLPAEIAPFVMPVANILLFFALELGVCALIRGREGRNEV